MRQRRLLSVLASCKNTHILDGNAATAHVAYGLADTLFLFPITPSSPASELTDVFRSEMRNNCFGDLPSVEMLQSESGVAGAVRMLMHSHSFCADGSASAGAYATTFTCAQGLLLMIPSLFRIAGELSPAVFHVSARGIAKQAHTVFNDHSDVMAIRSTGVNMLSSTSVQEAHDMAVIAHLSAIEAGLPWVHFYDGFRTSHEVQKVELLDYDEILDLVDLDIVAGFRRGGLNPEHPVVRGSTHPPSIYFQNVELSSVATARIPEVLRGIFRKFGDMTGREYSPFEYHGAPDAEHVVVVMGSAVGVARETLEFTLKNKKCGVVNARVFRPWCKELFLECLPRSVRRIAVLDRTKEMGSVGEPLYLDVVASLQEAKMRDVEVVGGRYGLAGKEFDGPMCCAVFENLEEETPKNHFTVGIIDDVSGTSLKVKRRGEDFKKMKNRTSCLFYGYGNDGTVEMNRLAVEMLGDARESLEVQAFFVNDSAKRSRGITRCHLRFSEEDPIRSGYEMQESEADYVSAHHFSYVRKYDLLSYLSRDGVLVLNCSYSDKEELERKLPSHFKKGLALKRARFYPLNFAELAVAAGLSKDRVDLVIQVLFLCLSNVVEGDEAIELFKQSLANDKLGMLGIAIDRIRASIHEFHYPRDEWAAIDCDVASGFSWDSDGDFASAVHYPMSILKGDEIPVSAFLPYQGGRMPAGGSRLDKRRAASLVPSWIPDRCTQCGQCTFVCPHADIRAFLLTSEEAEDALEGFDTIPVSNPKMEEALAGARYRIQVSTADCVSCENCVVACSAGALEMVEADDALHDDEAKLWEFALSLGTNRADGILDKFSVEGVQFRFPYFEFPASCAGCAESAYVRLLTQLYGSQLSIANPAGCMSIWTKNTPSYPLCVDAEGHGPTYCCSLFESNAEFGLGMLRSHQSQRDHLRRLVESELMDVEVDGAAGLFRDWLEHFDDLELAKIHGNRIKDWLVLHEEELDSRVLKELNTFSHLFSKVSNWFIGGDGWAYEINFGGLVHVLSMDQPTKFFILDTEIYSNTGGQVSKATQIGAAAGLASSGKTTSKMDLGEIIMSLGNVYVASVSFADPEHLLRSFREAEEFDGPACLIAYCPCDSHGIEGALKHAQYEQFLAVRCGYWPLYTFDPSLPREEQFEMISSRIDIDRMDEFMMRERRFQKLRRSFPDEADRLQSMLKEDLLQQYEARMAKDGRGEDDSDND